MKYYRPLEPQEPVIKGDGFWHTDNMFVAYDPVEGFEGLIAGRCGNRPWRPVEIVEHTTPKFTGENETWEVSTVCPQRIHVAKSLGLVVCQAPSPDYPNSFRDWDVRARRILAGQEALKMIERHRARWQTIPTLAWTSILNMLKD